jgi:hypothetical protein
MLAAQEITENDISDFMSQYCDEGPSHSQHQSPIIRALPPPPPPPPGPVSGMYGGHSEEQPSLSSALAKLRAKKAAKKAPQQPSDVNHLPEPMDLDSDGDVPGYGYPGPSRGGTSEGSSMDRIKRLRRMEQEDDCSYATMRERMEAFDAGYNQPPPPSMPQARNNNFRLEMPSVADFRLGATAATGRSSSEFSARMAKSIASKVHSDLTREDPSIAEYLQQQQKPQQVMLGPVEATMLKESTAKWSGLLDKDWSKRLRELDFELEVRETLSCNKEPI